MSLLSFAYHEGWCHTLFLFDREKKLLSGRQWCVAIGAKVSAAFSCSNSLVRGSRYHGDGGYGGSFGRDWRAISRRAM